MLSACSLFVHPDRSWGWTQLRRERHGTLIAQLAVWPLVIVLTPEVLNDHPRFCQRPQLLPVQALVPKPTVEAFHKTVLPRAAGLDVDRLDPLLRQPALHDLRDELRAVVAPQIFGCPVLLDGLLPTIRFPQNPNLVFRRIPLAFDVWCLSFAPQTNTSHGPKKRGHVRLLTQLWS